MSEWTLKRGRYAGVDGPVLLVVMDGVGLGPDDAGNAFARARTPVLDRLFREHGCLPIAAHGRAVGLPTDDDMGNSEVGHNALGAGRVFAQGARLVNDAVDSGRLFEGDTWRWLIDGVRASGEALHFIGLLSDGNVHSHEKHLHALLRHAAEQGVKAARVHVLLDGRDVGETTALTYVDRLEQVLGAINDGDHDFRIASGGGRMHVTMDRYEADWDMVARGWALHVHGEGRRFPSARAAIETLREESPGVTDQFLPGFVIGDADGPAGPIRDGASVVFFNFRGDRAIEISRAFEDDDFSAFDRGRRPDVRYAGMMQYDGDLKLPARFLVQPPAIDRTMGEYLARNGVSQFACSETQKYGHVTYFWNGNRSGQFDGDVETYVEIASDRVPFEQRPWMKAAEIVDATTLALMEGVRHARINLANGDMVGHTGDLEAAIVAMNAVDLTLGRLLRGVEKAGGVALITADHGNCEEMIERDKKGALIIGPDGKAKARTSHTTNPVPLVLFDPHGKAGAKLKATVERPGLSHLAATTLELLGFAPPEDYDPSLLGVMRRLALLLAVAGCDDGGLEVEADAGVPRVRPTGELVVDLDGPCRHPVLQADAEGVLRVRTPAPEGSVVEARVVDGPGRLVEGDRPQAAVQGGEARFRFACAGFGVTHVFARDDQGRTAVSAEILCARPSGFARACASNVPPRPLGPFTVEQFAPTGDLGRRLAPRGRSGVGVEDHVTVKLRLVFDGGLRPETGGAIEVSVADGALPGVEVTPARVATEPGTGEASVVVAAGDGSGTFVLRYAGLLDGERVEVDSRPFVVTRPPADTVSITCAGGDAPRPWFDERGGVRVDAEGVRCRLEATADGGPPVEGTRAWVLTEAGTTNRRPRTLEADGAVEVYVDPGRPPPRDVAPIGPSPLDALATVVGIVESTEPFDDVDGDGVFTPEVDGFDPADDVEEPYVDADDDGRYTPGEIFFDTDGDGAWSPANGVPDALALRWAATRLRWVGPLDVGPDALRLDCAPPRCFDAPVPDLHAACAGPMDAWLAEDATVTGEARAVDRNGQCVAEAGAARWFVEPPGALVIEGDPPRLGPCGLGGAPAAPFRLLLKRAAEGPVRFGWRAPDGAEVARTVCAP